MNTKTRSHTRTKTLESLEGRRLLSAVVAAETPTPPATTATVRGNVFNDANSNAVRESTESGQPNIRVYLDYNNNGIRDGDAEPISITNSLGTYTFPAAQAPATIAVRLLLTGTNFTQTRPVANAARMVTTVAGGNTELESFGVHENPPPIPTPTPPTVTVLTGTVYMDLNRSGARDSNELGRANVSVYLDTNSNGLHDEGEALTTTNSEGRYRFEHVPPGTTTIALLLTGTNLEQTQPAAGAAVVATVTDGQINEADAFGVAEKIVIPPPPPPAVTVLTGIVYTDLNRSGVRDSNELGRPNVSVYIDTNNDGTREDGEPVAITNTEGRYRFESITPGSKTLRLLLAGTNLDQTQPVNGQPVTSTVLVSQVNQADAFGVAEKIVTPPPPPPVTTAIISGNVFYDTNQDATRQSTEAGRANVRVYLDLNNNAKRDDGEPSLLTNSAGHYQFDAAPARNDLHIRLDLTGTNLKQTLPTNNAARVLATVAGHTYVDQNFGVHEIVVTPPPVTTGTIRGRVFNDVNHNGKQDAGDLGVPNRIVYLDTNHSGFLESTDTQVLTDASGNYVFEKVPVGTYIVRLRRGDLTQTSPSTYGAYTAVVKAGGIVGDLFFGTYKTPVAASAPKLVVAAAIPKKSIFNIDDIVA